MVRSQTTGAGLVKEVAQITVVSDQVQQVDELLQDALGSASRGELEKSAACYRRVLSLNPNCGKAHYGLAMLRIFDSRNDDIMRMRNAFGSGDISTEDRILAGYALGMSLDTLKRFDEAFEYFQNANKKQRESISYSATAQKNFFDRHKKSLGKKLLDHCKADALSDDTPILVLGMPRSGTSLVEQILASHPSVFGSGEVEYSRLIVEEVRRLTGKPFPENIDEIAAPKLRELAAAYIEKLKNNAGAAHRVTDKLPHNFLRIGLFVALIPRAKIILCNRNQLDTCWSIYQHHFSANHGYACGLEELGEYYKLFRNLMTFWCETFPGCMYCVEYEKLVESTESEIRDLLEYCELQFDDNCLNFHQTERVIDTPSAHQVRHPIYTDAIDRAKNYEKFLGPLIEALA